MLELFTAGLWLVTTRDSSYEMDLDAMTIVRFAGEGAKAQPFDGEPLRLVWLILLEVGSQMVAVATAPGEDADWTKMRVTSPVLGVDSLDHL